MNSQIQTVLKCLQIQITDLWFHSTVNQSQTEKNLILENVQSSLKTDCNKDRQVDYQNKTIFYPDRHKNLSRAFKYYELFIKASNDLEDMLSIEPKPQKHSSPQQKELKQLSPENNPFCIPMDHLDIGLKELQPQISEFFCHDNLNTPIRECSESQNEQKNSCLSGRKTVKRTKKIEKLSRS